VRLVAEVRMGWMNKWQHVMVLLAVLLVSNTARGGDARELGRVTAKAAVVLDARTGTVLFARNPTLPLPPASTTKVLTALIAMQQLSPDALLRVSAYASSMPPSKAWLRSGWEMSTRDLLYALLLRSANDASVVLAEAIAGSVPAFARVMNTTAQSLGTTQSNFVTPNGLPASSHYSTARDIALILRHALTVPGMREVLSTRTAVIQPRLGSRKRIALRSTNKMLWRDDLRVIGKTGWTRQAKRCFVGAATFGGREVIVSVLGSSDLWSDVEILANYGLAEGAGGEWSDQSGWQQAAVPAAPGASAWSLPSGDTGELAAVAAPARRNDERRAMRLAAAPPAGAYGRRGKRAAAAPATRAPQGDGGEVARGKLRYSLHIGSFRSKARADKLRKDVAKRGYRAEVQPVGGNYRVSVPSFQSRDAARKAARALGRTLRVDPVIVASK
jgi:D-alanyl-D-alanine carboxypeptidase